MFHAKIHLHIHVNQALSGVHPIAIGNQQLPLSAEESSLRLLFRRFCEQLYSFNEALRGEKQSKNACWPARKNQLQ